MSKEAKGLGSGTQISSITEVLGIFCSPLQIHRPPSSTLLPAEEDPLDYISRTLTPWSGQQEIWQEIRGGRRISLGFYFLPLSPQVCLSLTVSHHRRCSSSQGGVQYSQVIISAYEHYFLMVPPPHVPFPHLLRVSLRCAHLPYFVVTSVFSRIFPIPQM